jgi:RHS repeat-associated protein
MKHLPLPFILALVFASLCPLHAQVGNNNPSGASGIFNGQVNTGCSYDPYTGNATRSITDIAVAGAVGEYPLALVRTSNSRNPSTTEWFGYAGGWNHNYNWTVEDSSRGAQNFRPARYTVNFPDGRAETFRAVTWDTTAYRVRPGADTPAQSSSSGVRERLVPINPPGNMYAYLILPDGGKVKFGATQYSSNGQFYYKYKAASIIDPYGLETSFTYEVVGNGLRRLTKVTEPAGRYLQFSYATPNGPRISQVQEFINGIGRRAVQYYYSYTMLDHVVYYSNPNWTASYQYTGSNIGQNLPPLLWTCDDPMYPGPMRRIAYQYKPATPNNPDGTTPVYGQILKERYWDGVVGHETIGQSVSELTVGESPNVTWKRKEIRGDGKTRTFVYSSGGHVTWASDFTGDQSTQIYNSTTKYVNATINFNRIQTDYTNNVLTGNVEVITYPTTQVDTPNQTQRPTARYQYGWAHCPDPNNRDANNPYYLYSVTDEGNHTTTFTRDTNKRVTRIDYPDGGYETFDYNGFGEILSHRIITGSTETFTYDGRGLKQTYRNPDNASNNPTARYQYDAYDRVSDVTDVLGSLGDANHTISFSYNLRGQLAVTTLPNDNGSRHTVTNYYNDDGTLRSQENELYQSTQYTYDDYRRLKTVTPPGRGWGDNGTYTTYLYYGANASDDPGDYKFADSNATFVVLPSGKRTAGVYDDNRRRTSVTVGSGSEAALTGYGYDNVGNLTSVTNPLDHANVSTLYDDRNRPYSVIVGDQVTRLTYDTAGRKKTISRPNGQVITYESYDLMNRVLEQSATQTPTGTARANYTYYAPGEGQPVGFLKEFIDPSLYGNPPTDKYTYTYDSMGRKSAVTYPAEPGSGVRRVERWTYDNAGRLQQYTNRANVHQSFSYDGLKRLTDFSWDDGLTPGVHFDYDVASRLTGVTNTNAIITRAYYNDNVLRSETESIAGGDAKTVSYSYDADSNRANTTYPTPESYGFGYTYTGRNQLRSVNNYATFGYDTRGNLTSRNLVAINKQSTYSYDTLDRVTQIVHPLKGSASRTFNYGYYPHSNDRKWTQRLIVPNSVEHNKGEVFSYDQADQVTAVQLDIASPNTANPGDQTILYDSNGNRMWYAPPGVNKHYDPDSNHPLSKLNQYTGVTINGSLYNLAYRADANLAQYDRNNSSYSYDAQNRVTSATVGGVTMYFAYDGLNRQVSRKIAANGTPTYNVWDGWDLIEEYQLDNHHHATTTAVYLYGAGGIISAVTNGQFRYYYQDGSGSTALLTDSTGQLLEWYRYDLDGTPFFHNPNDTQRNPNQSGYGVRHLFTGQQWYGDIGLYDLRNRFYSPDLGRFLQSDPIGFRGGNNLYRYCGNNPVTRRDRFGLQDAVTPPEGWSAEVHVTGSEIPDPIDPGGTGAPSGGGGGGGAGEAGGGNPKFSGITFSYGKPTRKSNSNTQQQPPGVMVPFDIYHPTTTAEFIIAGNIIEYGDTTDTITPFNPLDFFTWGIAGLLRTSVESAAAKVIGTPYGRAIQSTSAEAQAALRQIRSGATVYKGGVLGRSETSASQFLSLENPLNPGYASRYGIPPQNANFNFILSGRVQPGAPLITRPAAGVAPNIEAGVEGVTTPGSFIMDSFYMPE